MTISDDGSGGLAASSSGCTWRNMEGMSRRRRLRATACATGQSLYLPAYVLLVAHTLTALNSAIAAQRDPQFAGLASAII
jgi:hypothetical protein